MSQVLVLHENVAELKGFRTKMTKTSKFHSEDATVPIELDLRVCGETFVP